MSEASFASLGPTLLARKGGAKPAMRPQLAPLPETVQPEQLEDLGWNDMGVDEEAAENGNIVSINPTATPAPANEDSVPVEDAPVENRAQAPLVKAKPAPKKAKAKKAGKSKAASARKAAVASAKRAAFTLRLDADRHLKLRLASTMQGVSAQALVTEALDALFGEIDDLDTLARTMGGRMKHH